MKEPFDTPKSRVSRRSAPLIAFATALFLVADFVYPISNRWTRLGGLLLIALLWIALSICGWRWRSCRFVSIATPLLILGVFICPSRGTDQEKLRSAFCARLRAYSDARYIWGGESFSGIDCSGLMRRGYIEALAIRGCATVDGGLLRRAFVIWWNDESAREYRHGTGGFSAARFEVETINKTDPSLLRPGDLAADEAHIMAYVGENYWIEADPTAGKVLTARMPGELAWFRVPMQSFGGKSSNIAGSCSPGTRANQRSERRLRRDR